MFACLSVCLYVFMLVCLYVCLCAFTFVLCLSLCLCLPLCLSLCLFTCFLYLNSGYIVYATVCYERHQPIFINCWLLTVSSTNKHTDKQRQKEDKHTDHKTLLNILLSELYRSADFNLFSCHWIISFIICGYCSFFNIWLLG